MKKERKPAGKKQPEKKAAEKRPERPKIEKTTETLEVKLTQKEMNERSKDLAAKLLELRRKENERASFLSQKKAEVEQLEGSVNNLTNIINSGAEFRPVKVEIHFNYSKGEKYFIRQDNGETYRTLALSPDEMQLKLFNPGPEEKKKEGNPPPSSPKPEPPPAPPAPDAKAPPAPPAPPATETKGKGEPGKKEPPAPPEEGAGAPSGMLSKICEYCGGEFFTANPQKKFCSDKCKDNHEAEQKRKKQEGKGGF